jgi:hypothetical protein
MFPDSAAAGRGMKEYNGNARTTAVAVREADAAKFHEPFTHLCGRRLSHHRDGDGERDQTRG